MATITSINLTYDYIKERVHAATPLGDGQMARTQRLARRLVAAPTGYLEKSEAIPLPSVREAVMAQEQAQAVSAIKPSTPVAAEADAPVHLVSNITLNLAAEKVELLFDSGADVKPAIIFDRTLVRQWLSMLHRQFVAAEWPLDVWPVWLTEGSDQTAALATRH